MPEEAKGRIELVNRKRVEIEGVKNVGSFDEDIIELETNLGVLILKGEGLHITHLDLESGHLVADGFFTSVNYVEAGQSAKKGKSILSRMFK